MELVNFIQEEAWPGPSGCRFWIGDAVQWDFCTGSASLLYSSLSNQSYIIFHPHACSSVVESDLYPSGHKICEGVTFNNYEEMFAKRTYGPSDLVTGLWEGSPEEVMICAKVWEKGNLGLSGEGEGKTFRGKGNYSKGGLGDYGWGSPSKGDLGRGGWEHSWSDPWMGLAGHVEGLWHSL